MRNHSLVLLLLAGLATQSCQKELATDSATAPAARKAAPTASVSPFASGLNDPRGLKFGPDGALYVAEAGVGGTISSTGFNCPQAAPPFGPYLGSPTGGRVSRIDAAGNRTTVTDMLPSSTSSIDDHMGPADVAFMDGAIYVLLNGGCSRALPNIPSGVYRLNGSGAPTLVANLSAWQAAHPVANPEPGDFEPDGAWYSMVVRGRDLYALDANHGELVKVSTDGTVSRVVDVSASMGHIVPTALDFRGNFYMANLGTFPISGESGIFKIAPNGVIHQVASGFSAVLGLVIDQRSWMYVLEMTSGAPFPQPGLGRIISVSPSGEKHVLVSGLNFPTGMTMGPDGNLYVSTWGFGMPPGGGQVMKVTLE